MTSKIQFIGKFFDNHSLAIVNRNIALNLKDYVDLSIIPLDAPNSEFKVDGDQIEQLLDLAKPTDTIPDVQLRHSYPPIWKWQDSPTTKIAYIQPWEFMAIPSEWQYKFDTFADAIISPSTWTTEVYKNSGINPYKLYTVANGYNPDIFCDKGKTTDEVKILYVGCSQFRKGIDVLLKMWAMATKKNMNISLTIKDTPQVYGKSNLLEEVTRLQYKTGCAKITYDDSSKSEQEMAEMYQDHHILVHPYRGEGFGMHIQEAMACGCVPVVTANGATEDFVTDYKIASTTRVVNMRDIFALKPEDSMSMMGSHKWVLEPDINNFATVLNQVINNINTINVDTSKLKTWSVVAKDYEAVLNQVAARNTTQRLK